MRKKIFVFVPLFVLIIVLASTLSPIVAMSEDVSTKVFRLHILANSNEDFDQQLKLKVRDRILIETKDLYQSCNSVDEAIKITQDNLDFIEDTAQRVVVFYGYDYDVEVEITKEYFNTRFYDSFTMPAGIYNCLKINIGEAKGKNWWCVMFPSVCISGCTDDFAKSLNQDEIDMICSKGYVIRFKAVEIYENIKSKINP